MVYPQGVKRLSRCAVKGVKFPNRHCSDCGSSYSHLQNREFLRGANAEEIAGVWLSGHGNQPPNLRHWLLYGRQHVHFGNPACPETDNLESRDPSLQHMLGTADSVLLSIRWNGVHRQRTNDR